VTKEEFEETLQEAFDLLPERFRSTIENVRVVVEEDPDRDIHLKHVRGRGMLLGLYQGVPLNRRGTEYGAYPVIPDTITLFKRNIESAASTDEEIRVCIRDVLMHEIGHYYGMTEEEIRRAGY
jgi:predicted Zn-dependent protease with MMP-like domain